MTDTPATPEVGDIDLEVLEAAIAAGAPVIDVRETDEYYDGHVPSAVHVPLGSVPERLDAFSDEVTTYVICRSGGRSRRAAEYAAAHGKPVVNVAGGTAAWVESGRPVVEGASPS